MLQLAPTRGTHHVAEDLNRVRVSEFTSGEGVAAQEPAVPVHVREADDSLMLITGPENIDAHLERCAEVGLDHAMLDVADANQINQETTERSLAGLGERLLPGDSRKPALGA